MEAFWTQIMKPSLVSNRESNMRTTTTRIQIEDEDVELTQWLSKGK